jgi:tRNA1(Val) A37 N6-methylase TrmN6
VVLNTKAANARAMTGCQLAWGVAAERLIERRGTLTVIKRPPRTSAAAEHSIGFWRGC